MSNVERTLETLERSHNRWLRFIMCAIGLELGLMAVWLAYGRYWSALISAGAVLAFAMIYGKRQEAWTYHLAYLKWLHDIDGWALTAMAHGANPDEIATLIINHLGSNPPK